MSLTKNRNYKEVIFTITPLSEALADLLSGALAEIGFESFIAEDFLLKGYVKEINFNHEEVSSICKNFFWAEKITFITNPIESVNWNEEWEKNYFRPIVIDNACVIHSSFHKDVPSALYDIVIDPKMSFGTGYHQTTYLMIQHLLQADLQNKSLLDMGCGTSVLAILASKKGGDPITAIDIDPWCIENSKENFALNGISNIQIKQGGAEILGGEFFDIILANINRNILLKDMEQYISALQKGGAIYFSGFYREDIPSLEEKALSLGLQLVGESEKENWASLHFVKKLL